jgi:hypothetical protein
VHDDDDALPPQVAQLLRDLGGVLADARRRLDALLPIDGDPTIRIPAQRAPLAPPTTGSR